MNNTLALPLLEAEVSGMQSRASKGGRVPSVMKSAGDVPHNFDISVSFSSNVLKFYVLKHFQNEVAENPGAKI